MAKTRRLMAGVSEEETPGHVSAAARALGLLLSRALSSRLLEGIVTGEGLVIKIYYP